MKWEKYDYSNKSTNYHSETHVPVHTLFKIYDFPDGVALPGQYTFPFRIQIPGGLPSSVYLTGRSNSKVVVEYSIKAILEAAEGTGAKEMSFKTPLIMREQLREVPEDIRVRVERNIMVN